MLESNGIVLTFQTFGSPPLFIHSNQNVKQYLLCLHFDGIKFMGNDNSRLKEKSWTERKNAMMCRSDTV